MEMSVSKTFRMLDWLVLAIVLTVAIALIAPHQLPVTAYKLSLVSLAAVSGYWLDRSLFPYARPDAFRHWRGQYLVDTPEVVAFAASQIRRAMIIAACVIGVSLGA